MNLKQIALIFIIALTLLLLLIGGRTGLFLKIKLELWNFVTIVTKNTSVKKVAAQKNAIKIESLILDRLQQLEIASTDISVFHLLEDSTIEIKATVPKGKPTEWIIWYITSPAPSAGYAVADCFLQESPFNCTIVLKSHKPGYPAIKVRLLEGKKYFSTSAKMAIIIADFGFHADITTVEYLSFPEPVTISLIPSAKMAVSTAQIAHEHQKEILLLLPMEPLSRPYSSLQQEAILLHHTTEQIATRINKAAATIPYYTGFANLCGSRILNDSEVMTCILKQIKEKNGYFLIDHASSRSVSTTLARELRVPYRSVDISLDSTASSSASLTDTLHHAAMIAQKTGSIVISGRATSQFLGALKKELPYFKHNGIQLVPVSDLVHHP